MPNYADVMVCPCNTNQATGVGPTASIRTAVIVILR